MSIRPQWTLRPTHRHLHHGSPGPDPSSVKLGEQQPANFGLQLDSNQQNDLPIHQDREAEEKDHIFVRIGVITRTNVKSTQELQRKRKRRHHTMPYLRTLPVPLMHRLPA